TFQCRLMAFHPSIIDSVVVHELAHHYQFDHSKKFYDIVYRYCPDYDKLRKKLIHDQFEG
ncbi:MAG: M48 family metallopeptidase, partial [Bacilli bacterium]|nr:M48 family metallopeptidase [Bacilli bacterium]